MTIAHLLASSARRWPDRAAWVIGDRRASYAELAHRADALARGLGDRGLRPGDRVVIDLPNCPELIEALFACFWGGFVAVPVNWHLRPDEVAYIAGNCGARALILSGQHLDGCEGAVRVDVTGVPDAVPFDDLSAAYATDICHVDCAADDPAWLFYTSGTTGRPKGAILSHRNLLSMTLNYLSDVDAIGDSAVFLHAAPLTHGSGLYLLPAVARGATNVIMDTQRFLPGEYFAAVQRHRVTHGAFLAPTMLKRLVDDGNAAGADLSSLRSIVVGGAPLYTRDLEDARKLLGPIVSQIYGQGEAPMTISAMRAGDPAGWDRPGSAGVPFTGVSVEVRDENGRRAPNWVAGEVCVRGDVVMHGYWSNAEATAAALMTGWLRTGDIGYLDNAGYLFLTDRLKDVIISGGSNIYPREVEEVLLRHQGVTEASVIGVPDAEWGESVCAVVVLAPGADLARDELQAHCRTHLASFKKPRHVIFTDSLPKNAAGKVLKRELRSLVAERLLATTSTMRKN